MKKDATNKGFWERVAKLYTKVMSKNSGVYDAVCNQLGHYVSKDKNVLELACGTGQITFRMADMAGSWTATDYSENMIREAKKRKAEGEGASQTVFQVQDATKLTYEDGCFDMVVIANALHIMPEPDLALKEIYRVLKPDGILFAPTFVYEDGYSKLWIWLMEKIGFKTYHKWNKAELAAYINEHGFFVAENIVIEGKPLVECIITAVKNEKTDSCGGSRT